MRNTMTWGITAVSTLLLGVAILFLLTPDKQDAPSERAQASIKFEIEGMLAAKGSTIFEESTHVLTTLEESYKVRSTVLDLTPFEEKEVRVLAEQQGDSARATLNILTITIIGEEAREMVTYEIKHVLSTIALPKSWEQGEDSATFTSLNGGATIDIKNINSNSEEGQKTLQIFGEAESILVNNGTVAYRLVTDDLHEVYVPLPEHDAIVYFILRMRENPDAEKITFYQMLKDIEWVTPEMITKPKTAQTHEACGGIANKPCSAGFRCEKTTFEEGATGWCVDANTPATDLSTQLGLVVEEDEPKAETTGDMENTTQDVVVDTASEVLETPDTEEIQGTKKPISPKRTTWTVKSLGYAFDLPSNWWYRHIGAVDGTLSKVEIAEYEVTSDNVLVTIGVYKKGDTHHLNAEDIKIVTERNDETEFVVSGPAVLREHIQGIADSLANL